MRNHKILPFYNSKLLLCYAVVISCFSIGKAQNEANTIDKKENFTLAKIDSVSVYQIKRGSKTYYSIFEYYKSETFDEYDIWSDKMFGRCCSETDMSYSELLYFDISTSIENTSYPVSHLSDMAYSTTYAFKETQNVEISLKLKRNTEHHLYYTKLYEDDVLKLTDTILKPFRLSLVNGYTKSKKTFIENGRVKALEICINNTYMTTVQLKDSPLVQEFSVDFIFSKNDVVKLTPITYYKGTKYNDICISEIQSSLAGITAPSLNKKYVINEIWR